MAEPILKATNLETYYGPIMAIRGVSFDVLGFGNDNTGTSTLTVQRAAVDTDIGHPIPFDQSREITRRQRHELVVGIVDQVTVES